MKNNVYKFEIEQINFEVLNKAITTWGCSKQTDKTIEEMCELTKALLKYRLAIYQNKDVTAEKAAIEDETADVIIMLTQIMMMYCDTENVQKIITDKVNRLNRILEIKNNENN